HVHRAGAAVARDHGGHALGQVAEVGPGGLLGQRPVAVRVQVDEAGSGHQAGAVEDAGLAAGPKAADRDDAVAADGQVADPAGLAAAVVEGGAADDDVRLDGGVGGGGQGQQG